MATLTEKLIGLMPWARAKTPESIPLEPAIPADSALDSSVSTISAPVPEPSPAPADTESYLAALVAGQAATLAEVAEIGDELRALRHELRFRSEGRFSAQEAGQLADAATLERGRRRFFSGRTADPAEPSKGKV